jgi:transposase InsO family protein
MYLALVMDAYSRAIVGYHCSDNLETEGALKALKMALAGKDRSSPLIHHSDRGSQYCSHMYISELKKHGVGISMTEENHCYENSQAERLNGILKHEYGLGDRFKSKQEILRAVKEAVMLYNHCRPHQALGYKYPMQVHKAA